MASKNAGSFTYTSDKPARVVKYTKIEFKNIGPIESGEIRHKKISVLFGPNNSGKSIAAGLIHGVCQLNTAAPDTAMQADLLRDLGMSAKDQADMPKYLHGQNILYSVGIPRRRIITAGKKSCMLRVHSTKKTALEITFKFPKLKINQFQKLVTLTKATRKPTTGSFYVPAGRTGTVQYLTWISWAKSTLLRYMFDVFLNSQNAHGAGKKREQLISMPEHSERLYDLILQEDKLTEEVQDMFSTLFEGSVRMGTVNGIPRILYVDPSGFETEIAHAGSGVVSSLPILMSLQYVDDGGTLVIEEPEAHLEPVRQMNLVEKLVEVASHRKISLIFSTQSDYVLRKLLAMTASRKIKPKDLGLYYFKRTPGKFTNIEELVANEDGEVPQDIFDNALDALVKEILS